MKRIAFLLAEIFDAPTRAAVAGLWFVGAAFALSACLLAIARPGAGPYGAFLIVAATLAFIAVALLRSWTWAMAISLALLSGQVVGVLGATLELLYGIRAGKATELRALGVEPRLGVEVNLAFSLAATCVLAAAVFRAAKRLPTMKSD